jgi:hypothetical protein
MLPLESFKYGGLWWFTDITMRDPYFILPIVTVITLGVTLQVVLYFKALYFMFIYLILNFLVFCRH